LEDAQGRSGHEPLRVEAPTDVTVVIPARNVVGMIEPQLEALADQEFGGTWEVVVADNGSTDGTAALVAQRATTFPVPLRVVRAFRARGINVGRNDGVAAAAGRAILLCDADDEVAPGWLEAMAGGLDGVDLVGGSIDLRRLNSDWSLRTRPMGAPHEIGGVLLPIGANIGFRKATWERLGGFDEDFVHGAWDEHDFSYRAHEYGFRARAVPEAVVHYRLRADRGGMARQQWGIGRGEQLFRHKHPSFLPSSSLTHEIVQLGRSSVGLARRWVLQSDDRDAALGFVAYQCGRLAERAAIASRGGRGRA
jgi:glycosyltransferase involved in cell wall biosynthesis